jgi:hypothetical protein
MTAPLPDGLIDRVKPADLMLGDKAYDGNERRDKLQHGTKPVIPDRTSRTCPFPFSKHRYKMRCRIRVRSTGSRTSDVSRRVTISWRDIIGPPSALPQSLCGGLDPSRPLCSEASRGVRCDRGVFEAGHQRRFGFERFRADYRPLSHRVWRPKSVWIHLS